MATLSDLREQAGAALTAGDHARALSLAALMQSRFPRDYRTRQLLGRIALESQELQSARDAFAAVLSVDPEDVVSRSALAMIAEVEGDLEGALRHFQRAYDVAPVNREIASEIERLGSALNRPLTVEPGSSVHAKGRRLLLQRKYDSAVPWLEEARRIDPEATEVGVGLARALLLAWRHRDAEQVARDLLIERPDCLGALAILAGATHSRSASEARQYLMRLAELDPGNSAARALFAEAGFRFPEVEEDLAIPDTDVEAALAVLREEDRLDAPVQAENAIEPEPSPPVESVPETEPPLDEETMPAEAEGESQPQGLENKEDSPSPSVPVSASEDVEGEEAEAGAISPALSMAGMIGASEIAGRADLSTQRGEDRLVPEAELAERTLSMSAADLMAAAVALSGRGLVDQAVEQYAAALKLDRSSAREIGEAVLALADANPGNLRARWLAGDALATDGQFNRAVEQYLTVLKRE